MKVRSEKRTMADVEKAAGAARAGAVSARAPAGAVPAGAAPAGAEVVVEHVVKRFGRINAVRGVSLSVGPGEALLITGPSGSGKSTLLALMGGLERPDSGGVAIDRRDIWADPSPARLRREVVGFVFQRHLLLETLSARANVEVPLLGAGMSRAQRHRRALELLDAVGLARRADHVPAQLSGGERQRVAVARAIANQPRLLLADEPTGALDSATSARVLDLLFRLREELGMTMVVVSYDSAMSARADRTLTLVDGEIHDGGEPPAAEPRPAGEWQPHGKPRPDGERRPADGPQTEGEPRPAGEPWPGGGHRGRSGMNGVEGGA